MGIEDSRKTYTKPEITLKSDPKDSSTEVEELMFFAAENNIDLKTLFSLERTVEEIPGGGVGEHNKRIHYNGIYKGAPFQIAVLVDSQTQRIKATKGTYKKADLHATVVTKLFKKFEKPDTSPITENRDDMVRGIRDGLADDEISELL